MADLPDNIDDLIEFDLDTLRVSSREGKHREFKLLFKPRELSRYTKTLAAFANADGGMIIFGVGESPRRIEGIDQSTFLEEADWTNRLRQDFDPEITISIKEYQVTDKKVIVVQTDPNPERPVLCRRDRSIAIQEKGGDKDICLLKEGLIYYRYSGQTRPIGYTELQALLQERDDHRQRSFLESIQLISQIGPDRTGIVDIAEIETPSSDVPLYVTREIAKSLNFIDQGQFVEKDGTPAYTVAGKVQLNEVVERPIDELDKNLPQETAQKLIPIIHEMYGPNTPFTASHLAKLAKFLGIRSDEEVDEHYMVNEKKLKRLFYKRAGIDYIEKAIKSDPIGCLRAFASRETIKSYYDNPLWEKTS